VDVIAPGAGAPPVPGVDLEDSPRLLWFFKVTCPLCQMAAPTTERFEAAYPGTVAGVGQDPAPRLESFARDYGVTFPTVTDDPPYPVSDAYGIRTVPTLVLVDAGTVADVAESWDRDAINRVSERVAALTGHPRRMISVEGDGLPSFRPG
jgi:thiol-disulfide isomerase/thioredoxin